MSTCTLCLITVCVTVWYTVVIVSRCWHALSDYLVYAQTDRNDYLLIFCPVAGCLSLNNATLLTACTNVQMSYMFIIFSSLSVYLRHVMTHTSTALLTNTAITLSYFIFCIETSRLFLLFLLKLSTCHIPVWCVISILISCHQRNPILKMWIFKLWPWLPILLQSCHFKKCILNFFFQYALLFQIFPAPPVPTKWQYVNRMLNAACSDVFKLEAGEIIFQARHGPRTQSILVCVWLFLLQLLTFSASFNLVSECKLSRICRNMEV